MSRCYMESEEADRPKIACCKLQCLNEFMYGKHCSSLILLFCGSCSYLTGLQDIDLLLIHGVSVLFQEAFTLIFHLLTQQSNDYFIHLISYLEQTSVASNSPTLLHSHSLSSMFCSDMAKTLNSTQHHHDKGSSSSSSISSMFP